MQPILSIDRCVGRRLYPALCLLLLAAGCNWSRLHRARTQSWTLANRALEMTIERDGQGRLGMTHLRDRRTGCQWCLPQTPSPLFQAAFRRGARRFALSGRSQFDLLQASFTRSPDGTQTLRLLV